MRISRNSVRAVFWIVLPLFLTACIVPKIHEKDEFHTDPNATSVQTLSIDAKQRVVTFSKNKAGRDAVTITCAEPSPDALSTLSSGASGGLSDPKVAANFALAQAESAASIGLRTQSIQLLRDGMYRLCEGYAAGAITPDDFNRDQRRYQNLMLSLLAIEQLTGAVVAQQVGLGGGSASGSVGDKADEAASTLAVANADLASAQSALKKAQATQASDESNCKANPSSASCGNTADDQTRVDSAQTTLTKATEGQKTAQSAMLAARAAVKADAAGAVVSFSNAQKTNPISDNSARYIAEATRAIVSTTLIASFAQEECTNVWTLIQNLPQADRLSVFALDGSKPNGAAGEIVAMAKNCQHNEDLMLGETGLLIPQYGATPPAALQVLGAQGGITMMPTDPPRNFIIVGGIAPYRVSGLAPQLKSELEASIPKSSVNGDYELLIQRPKGASKKDKTNIFVVDAINAYVEIPVTLESTVAAKPAVPPKSAIDASAPTNVTATAGASGNILVTFALPKDTTITQVTAKAVDKTDSKATALTHDGKLTDTTIDLSGCVDKHSYDASVTVVDASGSHTGNAAKAVTCTAAAAVPSPPNNRSPKPPTPPTNVKAEAGAGEKITVSFTASTDAAVTSYTATAMSTKGGGNSLKESTPSGKAAPIILSNCTDGTSYVVTVVANITGASSDPAKANGSVKCSK